MFGRLHSHLKVSACPRFGRGGADRKTKVHVAVKETLASMGPEVPPVRKVYRVNAVSLESLVSLVNVVSMDAPVVTVQQV